MLLSASSRPGRSPVCARDPRTSPTSSVGAKTPLCRACATLSRRINHRPSLAACLQLALASPAAHPVQQTTLLRPSLRARRNRVLQLDRKLICALLNFGIVQRSRSVPGHGLFDSPLHHPARARQTESVRKSERESERARERPRERQRKRASSAYPPSDTLVLSMRISQRATLRISPAPHRHRRAQAQLRDRTA